MLWWFFSSTKLGTKHPWVKGTPVCLNEGFRPFPRGDNNEIANNTLSNLKNLLLQNHWTNFNKTWHNASLGEGPGIQDCSTEGLRPFPRGDNNEIAKIHCRRRILKIFYTPEPLGQFQPNK